MEVVWEERYNKKRQILRIRGSFFDVINTIGSPARGVSAIDNIQLLCFGKPVFVFTVGFHKTDKKNNCSDTAYNVGNRCRYDDAIGGKGRKQCKHERNVEDAFPECGEDKRSDSLAGCLKERDDRVGKC